MTKRMHGTGLFIATDVETQKEHTQETFTCAHCSHVGLLKPKRVGDFHRDSDNGGWCFKCHALLCSRDACHANCIPFLQLIGVA